MAALCGKATQMPALKWQSHTDTCFKLHYEFKADVMAALCGKAGLLYHIKQALRSDAFHNETFLVY